MADARDYQSDFEAAEAAATQGDFVRAESLLRSGLARQEATLGGAHPEVASTLNNLAVVCETLGRIDDAERFYRRAHAVASATRPDDDPLVTTSRANLQDFCRTHGRRAEDTAPPTAAFEPAAATPVPTTTTAAPGAPVTRQAERPARPAAAGGAPRAAATPAGASASVPRGFAVALFLVATLATAAVSWLWLRPTVPVASSPAAAAESEPTSPAEAPPAAASRPASASTSPAVTAPAAPVAATPPAVAAAPATVAAAPPTAVAPPAATPPADTRPATDDDRATGPVRVVNSQLCAPLETSGRAWRCTPVGDAAAPGRVSFVTRVASPRPVRLQHRWSQNGTVRQTVTLSVAASPTEGYRTFSRQTVTPGAWTVALVDAGGAVLGEVSFAVR